MYVCMYVCMYVRTYVRMYVCMYVSTKILELSIVGLHSKVCRLCCVINITSNIHRRVSYTCELLPEARTGARKAEGRALLLKSPAANKGVSSDRLFILKYRFQPSMSFGRHWIPHHTQLLK